MLKNITTGKNVKIPFVRKPAKWVIGKLANWVTGMVIPDINSGLRVFKKSSFFTFFAQNNQFVSNLKFNEIH